MNDNIFKALGIFLEGLRPFVKKVIEDNFQGKPWEGEFFRRLKPNHQGLWNQAQQQGVEPLLRIDYHNMIDFIQGFRDELAMELGNKDQTYKLENCIREIKEIRNKTNHYTPLTSDEIDRTYSNMKTVANMLHMKDLRHELDRLTTMGSTSQSHNQSESKYKQDSDQSRHSAFKKKDDSSLVQSWYNYTRPSYDICQGTLNESIFAANLTEVALGIGPEVYSNPIQFFAKTYVTAGLHDIVNRVVRALNGQDTENRVISLQTGFGGGKTHTLISLYHVAKYGKNLLNYSSCDKLFENSTKPEYESATVAVFTQNTADVVQGDKVGDGIHIFTLWGEIAYQLGGKEGYERIRENDEARIAPASSIIKPIIEQAGPSLILIDELADYCSKAEGKSVGASNLFAQTTTFIQTLTEVVSSIPRCVLIVTLPASASEIAGTQKGQEILDALQNRVVRIGSSV